MFSNINKLKNSIHNIVNNNDFIWDVKTLGDRLCKKKLGDYSRAKNRISFFQ